MNDFPIIKYKNALVITSDQVANMYGTTKRVVSNDFNRNKSKFTEGKHYFKLTGEELKQFRDIQNLQSSQRGLQISGKTRTIYLWTNRGALLLAKIIDTDIAWTAYEKLVDFYFDKKDDEQVSEDQLSGGMEIPEHRIPVRTATTPVPLQSSFYQRYRRKMDRVANRMNCSSTYIYSRVLKRVNESYDLEKCEKLFVKETGHAPKYTMDLLTYFEELGEVGGDFVDRIEEESIRRYGE